MDKKLSLLIVEDDREICDRFAEYIAESEDIALVGVTNSEAEALDYTKDYLPDAIILDLELHRGSGNGLTFLQKLQTLELEVKPYVLVTTNNSSAVTYGYARTHGADFIMHKHQEDYCEKSAIDFLRMIRPAIDGSRKSADPELATTESPDQREKRITRRISSELNLVGISPKLKGYQYLIDAIKLVMTRPTQNLCSVIGAAYGKTEPSVERAMQNAINKAWRTTDINELLEHYTAKISSERGVPTITEFVYYYANKIKNEY